MSEISQRRRILRSSADSAVRVIGEREVAARSLGNAATRERLKDVARPNSISGTLRKTGVALILAPDPVTAVPGALMLGAALVTSRRRPLSPASLLEEARKLMEEMASSL